MPAPSPTSDLDYADKLWQAADKLRGQVDPACGSGGIFGATVEKPVLHLASPSSDKATATAESAPFAPPSSWG